MDIRLLLFAQNVEASLGLRPFSGKCLLVIVGLQEFTYASSLAAAMLKICSQCTHGNCNVSCPFYSLPEGLLTVMDLDSSIV
jgi:hypothetical protein